MIIQGNRSSQIKQFYSYDIVFIVTEVCCQIHGLDQTYNSLGS